MASGSLVIAGLVHAAARGFSPVPIHNLAIVESPQRLAGAPRAFASGSAAMTGIEAICNAVPAFRPVEWRNPRITLTWMVAPLIGTFAGVLAISRLAGVVPVASQTMLSHLAHLSFGGGPMYFYVQVAAAVLLSATAAAIGIGFGGRLCRGHPGLRLPQSREERRTQRATRTRSHA